MSGNTNWLRCTRKKNAEHKITIYNTIMVCVANKVSSHQNFPQPHINYGGYEVLGAVTIKSSIFWNINICFLPAFTLASCSAYSSTMMMEAACFSETSDDFQWATWRYIQKDRTLHRSITSWVIHADHTYFG
jgi:hypothetical protein